MDDHIYDARAMIREATVVTVNDGEGLQTVDVVTDEGSVYSGIPVMQAWGHASSPPKSGLKAMLLCVGGDPANMRAILYSTARRMGGMNTGETGVYANNGSRVALLQGGTINVQAGAVVQINAPNVTIVATTGVTITAPLLTITALVALEGNLTVDGNITSTGSIHADGGVH